MDLPTEVLSMIFAYFSPGSDMLQDDENRRPSPTGHGLLAIRSTCHRFRDIADELPFWYNGYFRLQDIIPARRKWQTDDDGDQYQAGFLRILFKDPHLVRTLQRRKVWYFKNVDVLLAVIAHVPYFREQINSVILSFPPSYRRGWKESSGKRAIPNLALCTNLVSLELHAVTDPDELDLTLITDSLPLLERLRLLQCSCDFTGTLRDASRLSELHIQGDVNDKVKDTDESLVPLSSASSLTYLALLENISDSYPDHDVPPRIPYQNGALDIFTNLTSLYIHPFTEPLCDFLSSTSKLHLIHFRTSIIAPFETAYFPRVIRMFSRPSFSKLESLRFGVSDEVEWTAYSAEITKAISTYLTGLEELVVGMDLDTTWCMWFSRCINLKRLVWFSPAPDGHRSCADLQAISQAAEDMFIAAFERFEEKPIVRCPVAHYYGQIWYSDTPPFLYDDEIFCKSIFHAAVHECSCSPTMVPVSDESVDDGDSVDGIDYDFDNEDGPLYLGWSDDMFSDEDYDEYDLI